jgi:enamine deaminase RidA (YjgF/YER057c/UK114 family)
MSIEALKPSGVAAPLGHLSNATRSGRQLALAGLVALHEDGTLVGAGSMREQTLHVCRTIQRVCEQ